MATTHGGVLPTMPWGAEEVSIMCVLSTDYYNRVSGESALYRLYGNDTDCRMDELSSHRQLHFTIKETTCQSPGDELPDDCVFLEDGVVKSCAALFRAEDDGDVSVVRCDQATPQRSRVRRSRSGRRGNGGRNGGRGGGRRGLGSHIAGVGIRGIGK
ncbi:cathelicidin-related antimicrobial peptide Bf-CRAMP-like [Leptodactylus fuscus]|uniref:cathelicidin-related antimicrobial peptide Bf-CRAMP-like n=1 Tax=Leptodactylus fuscus TaxID=238119 RepID=UPI003F4F2577